MEFTRQDNFYQVSRITGPTHNFLAITLVTEVATSPQIEALPGWCHHNDSLDPEAILNSVYEGIVLANEEFGTNYNVSHIQYRLGDNPPEIIYGFLAFKIVEYLVSGDDFADDDPIEGPGYSTA